MSKQFTLLVISMLMLIPSVFATKITWKTGSNINNFWAEPLNWDLGRIPNATDSVYTFYSDVIVYTYNYSSQIKYMKLLGSLTVPFGSELIFTNGKFDALGTVINYGTIRINNSPEVGLDVSSQAANQPFTNYGSIYIDNAATKGLIIEHNKTITNAAGGLIEITNSGTETMHIGNSTYSGIINNSGLVRIGVSGNAVGLKIENSLSAFNNLACGKVTLLDKLVITSGTLDNAGFFKQDFDGDNDMGVIANTTFNNHGIIEDRYGAFYVSDFDIQSIWIKLIEYKYYKTGEKVPIFTVSSPVGINMGNVFTDSLLTQNAGSYNLNTNIWIPNAAANGKSKFFIRASQQSNSCFDTLRFDLQYPIIAVNYWLGGTGAWQTAAKWSTGTVPVATDNVAIYNATDQVGVNNYTATARKIFLYGKITNTTTGIINIAGVALETAFVVEEGSIINNGIIDINNMGYGMTLKNSALTNNNSIKCNNTDGCISVSSFSGLTASINNTGIIENTRGRLIDGDATEINNSGSLIGYNPTYESIDCNNLINTGIISIEGDGVTGTGFRGQIKNMASGIITLKKLSSGGKFGGENHGMITSELCTKGFENYGIMTNKIGGEIIAKNNTIGMYLDASFFNNDAGGKITLTNNSLYGLQMNVARSIFDNVAELENEGVINITDNTGIGIYNAAIFKNQENGIVRVRTSGSHAIYLADGNLENSDESKLDIKGAGGHGVLNEGGFLLNNQTASISIDSVGMSGIYFGDYMGTFSISYGYMRNYSKIDIGPTVVANGLHLETSTYITNYECYGNIINRSKIQLDGLFTNYGIYRHLTTATSVIGTNLQNNGVTYDPNSTLLAPATWNSGIYIGKKTGTFNEGQSISSMLEVSPTRTTKFFVDTAWFLNKQLTMPGGIYDTAQNSLTTFGLAVDSSTFYFKIYNTYCPANNIDTFSLALQNPITTVCGKIVWIGGKGNIDIPSNWDRNRLPKSCDSVIIIGAQDSILVNTAIPIVVKHISNKGTIVLSPAANLTIQNSIGNGMYNEGVINNKGTLTIKNITLNGYVGLLNAQFINEGMLLIKDITQLGMDCTGGLMHNKVGATITIQNIMLDNILLRTGATFQQDGILNLYH